MSSNSKYDIGRISFEWVEETKDRKEIKKAYEAIKEDGGYYDLEQTLKKKLASLDPSFNRRVNETPLSSQEKENISTDLDQFLASANNDDESLQGKNAKNIFSNPKEEAAERIGKRKQAENERMKGNDFMKAKEYDRAIECYDKAISIDPNDPSAYSNRALGYINKKQYSNSIDDANKAIALNPDYIKAYYRRGKAYEECKKYDLAIKDYEHILLKEPTNKRIKKELLSLRAQYKAHNESEEGTKKFRKMKIEEEENTSKVQEIKEPKTQSEDPVISEEGSEQQVDKNEITKVESAMSGTDEGHTKSNGHVAQEVKTSEYVKLNIEEAEDSSEEEEEQKPPAPTTETVISPTRVKESDKEYLKNENVSSDFINSLEEEPIKQKPVEKKAPVQEIKQTPKQEPKQETKEEVKKEEPKEEPKEVEEVNEPTPAELEEQRLLDEIERELAVYKAGAKEQHQKGMFEHAIEIYQEALVYLLTNQEKFHYKLSELIVKKCAFWNNIAACYKQYQNADKEIEYSSLVIENAEHCQNHPGILYKAYFRRGCAYEKAEKYVKAKSDLTYCRQKQPFDMEVTKRLNHINDALQHEEQEKKTRGLLAPEKLTSKLEEHKNAGNGFFKKNNLDDAIEAFSEGIQLYKENLEVQKLAKCPDLTTIAISLYTNRALCYSKKKLDANVIADSTYVIENLSKKNVKAYYRRALSYKTYGQYKEAMADLNDILAFEPKNKDAQKELEEVKKLFEDELNRQYAKQQKHQANKQPEVQAKITEVKTEGKPKIEEIKEGDRKPVETKPVEHKKKVKIGEEGIQKAAKLAAQQIGSDKIRIPNTSYGFEADVNSLKKDDAQLYNYISHIPPSTYSKIYKKLDIEADYLVAIFGALNKFESDNDKILQILYHFSMTQNITMTMMFFNDQDRKLIEELLEKAGQAQDPNRLKMLERAKSMID